jgi:hypothetical protein
MTDHQDQAQHELDLIEQIKRQSDSFKPMRDLYAIFGDALKMVGAGNAAGVVATAAALKTFSEHTILIKTAGVIFLFGVFCYAIGFFLLFAGFIAAARVPGAIRRGKTMEFVDYQTNFASDWCFPGAMKLAFAGLALFFIGCVLGLIILILA